MSIAPMYAVTNFTMGVGTDESGSVVVLPINLASGVSTWYKRICETGH
jgi:hypothetical protein